jgi:hypothetical protein
MARFRPRVLRKRFRKWINKKSPVRWGYRRPLLIGPVQRLVERRLCARYDWDLDLFTGRVATSGGGSAACRLRHSYSLQPEIKALRIARWYRFGNSVIQLRNALYLAEKLNVQIIEFAQPHPFFMSNRVGGYQFVHVDRRPRRLTIEGSFFMLDAFHLSIDVTARSRLFKQYIRPLLTRQVSDADPRVNSEDLVLHFRAGDVFRQSKPPNPDYGQPPLSFYLANYGQPPLSFYLAVVEREKPGRVWLVFEDRGNPCVDAVESALRERGIEVMLQSASLADDLRLLLSARRLVASRGSFVHMIAHLSVRLRKVYFFEPMYFFDDMEDRVLPELGVEVVKVSDAQGEFKAKVLRQWSGLSEQRALILSYPGEKLKIESCLSSASK